MADIVDIKTRSRMMAGIKGKNTKPELLVRKFLHANGFRYRLHAPSLPGSPDIVLARYKTVIFVHGCFWHRHSGCKYSTCPEQNQHKWQKKFRENQERDQRQLEQLVDSGWKVIVIWECGLRDSNADLSWMIDYIKRENSIRLSEWPKLD